MLHGATLIRTARPCTSLLSQVLVPSASCRLPCVGQRAALADSAAEDLDENVFKKQIEQWKGANKMFNSSERDHTAFPQHKMPVFPPSYRLGFIPESWFRFFYEKTGVTGPYVFGGGLACFLLSKEHLVFGEVAAHAAVTVGVFWWLARMFGRSLGKYMDSYQTNHFDDFYYKPLREGRKEVRDNIEATKKMVEDLDAKKYIVQAKKENVDLQLEAQYRDRLQKVHQAVKARLDYQLAKQNVRVRFEQRHMVDWIVDNVVRSITPKSEAEYLSNCIANLKGLAPKAT